jgi:hypothetical protein
MRELPRELQIHSEALEPTFAHLIGKWYAQTQWNKQTYGPHSAAYVDSMQNWWWGMRALSRVMIACPGATHACVALSNEMQMVKGIIERELGIKFSFLDGDTLDFRSLVTFDLEFPEFVGFDKSTK